MLTRCLMVMRHVQTFTSGKANAQSCKIPIWILSLTSAELIGDSNIVLLSNLESWKSRIVVPKTLLEKDQNHSC